MDGEIGMNDLHGQFLDKYYDFKAWLSYVLLALQLFSNWSVLLCKWSIEQTKNDSSLHVFIPPANEVQGVYRNHFVRLSVQIRVCPITF